MARFRSVGNARCLGLHDPASIGRRRRLTALLRAEGLAINRKRVQRLMRKMGIAVLGPKPRTTKSAPGHKIFPYLLRGLDHRPSEPGVVRRHHLYPDQPRLALSGGDHGMGDITKACARRACRNSKRAIFLK
jgi:transposase InsO family protein